MNLKKTKLAFTLAEILISLGIIGVIAAITIPTLMQTTQQRETVSAVKKAFSIVSQAYAMAILDNGDPTSWGLTADGAGAVKMLGVLAPYFKITKNCGTGSGCYTPDKYKFLSGTVDTNSIDTNTATARAQLNDGTMFEIYIPSADCGYVSSTTNDDLKTVCGQFWIDVNGMKKPNQVGVDYFGFDLTKTKVIPIGTSEDSQSIFSSNCADKTNPATGGHGCTAWVVYNENLDYLKCPGTLAWNGPTSCN